METLDAIIQECANSNNLGIQYEKEGDIDAAIEVYEKNTLLNYPATHSYERLMVLYRKRKEYSKEIAVIEKAIELFSDENERRAEIAVNNYPSMAAEIQEALVACKTVCDNNDINQYGYPRVVFNPYDVCKYRSRLAKVVKLAEKADDR